MQHSQSPITIEDGSMMTSTVSPMSGSVHYLFLSFGVNRTTNLARSQSSISCPSISCLAGGGIVGMSAQNF
jgi:hypothetical protein